MLGVPLNLRPLLLPLLVALLLAGCAGPGADGGEGDDAGGAPATATTPEEARGLMLRAASEMPERVGVRVAVEQGARVMLAINGTFDNASGVSYLEVRGEPEAFQGASGEESPEDLRRLFEGGFSMYVTPEGGMYLANGTAFTFPPSNDSSGTRSLVPTPEESPFGEFIDPQQAVGALTAANVTIESVRPTTLRGKPAVEVDVRRAEGNRTLAATVTLFTQPVRVARVEGEVPADGPADPLAGARYAADFLYDADVTLRAPEAATRALGLAYRNDQPFGFGGGPVTWTFQGAAGIPLDEVEVQVKDTEGADPSDITGAGALPAAWSMRLSEGTRTQEGVTLAFTDADGDRKVSRGDTLRIEGPERPTVVLRDVKTGTYVIPGPGVALALLALAGLALVAGRRR